MFVPMMHIGIMRMSVLQAFVHVDMGMRLRSVPRPIMRMPVMLIVRMDMIMKQQIMLVHAGVVFGEM